MIAGLLFYMFALVLLASAVGVVTIRRPVPAVLLLILCFFNAAGLFLLLGAEFLAFILLIVYVGAVAVLFLFVVMMLDVRGQDDLRERSRRYLPVGLGMGGVLLVQMLIVALLWQEPSSPVAQAAPEQVSNTVALGRVLYTDFIYPFQLAGVILLVAMVGAISLTLRKPRKIKKQKATEQILRRREDVIEIRKIKTGEGAL
ncbi:MAG: NADH-quinone oxidoreductase subunit J [Proteobacteria bacterium]|jgi:NADH-quinone oxidoreductase subunit J|nr:NADH-quinone oxidoreductase subunit J [Alphaproteobacteria bacterium]NCC02915.1 NADH-quinone oxidoreductase subunit J [Pseudomonadota bacterium]